LREPSDSKWGLEIKKKALQTGSLTPEEELLLFQKDREENIRNNIKPSLLKKKVVILDRYYFSTIAYQGAKGISEQRIRDMNEAFVVKPDLIFILDIDERNGLRRIANRKKKDKLFECEEYLAEVRKKFKEFTGDNIIHIDATKHTGMISMKIKKIVFDYLGPLEI
jgi:dTMP kinase